MTRMPFKKRGNLAKVRLSALREIITQKPPLQCLRPHWRAGNRLALRIFKRRVAFGNRSLLRGKCCQFPPPGCLAGVSRWIFHSSISARPSALCECLPLIKLHLQPPPRPPLRRQVPPERLGAGVTREQSYFCACVTRWFGGESPAIPATPGRRKPEAINLSAQVPTCNQPYRCRCYCWYHPKGNSDPVCH